MYQKANFPLLLDLCLVICGKMVDGLGIVWLSNRRGNHERLLLLLLCTVDAGVGDSGDTSGDRAAVISIDGRGVSLGNDIRGCGSRGLSYGGASPHPRCCS